MSGAADMQAGEAADFGGVDPTLTVPLIAAMLVAWTASIVVAARLAVRLRRGLPMVDPRPHPPVTWGGADVAAVAAMFIGLLMAAGWWVRPESALRLQLAADVITKLGATLAGLAVLRMAGASWAALGFGGERVVDDLRIAVGGLALVLAPLLGIAAILDRIVPYRHPVVTFLQTERDPVAIGLVVLAAVCVAPVAEEFFFRRVLQGWLECRLPEADGAVAIGLSAAAFAAAHAGHGLAAGPLFLLGVVLGVVARRTGSLGACIGLHALFNAVSVGLILASPPGQGGA